MLHASISCCRTVMRCLYTTMPGSEHREAIVFVSVFAFLYFLFPVTKLSTCLAYLREQVLSCYLQQPLLSLTTAMMHISSLNHRLSLRAASYKFMPRCARTCKLCLHGRCMLENKGHAHCTIIVICMVGEKTLRFSNSLSVTTVIVLLLSVP